MTTPRNAHSTPRREIFARGATAFVMSCRHAHRQCAHRYRCTRTSSVVGRCPNGSCASRRVTVSLGTPSDPHLRHHGSVSTGRHSIVARSGSINWHTATSSSSSRRQSVVRSGVANVGWSTSRSFGDGEREELPSSGRPRPLPGHRRAQPTTPSFAMSPFTPHRSTTDYQEPGPGRDLMHANHAIHDVKLGLLRGREVRKIKETRGTVYLGVKGSQVQILSARPKNRGNSTVSAIFSLAGFAPSLGSSVDVAGRR